jgi:hypothetical protein
MKMTLKKAAAGLGIITVVGGGATAITGSTWGHDAAPPPATSQSCPNTHYWDVLCS